MSGRVIGIVIAGFLTVFIAFAVRYAYGLLLPSMLPDLGETKAGAGMVYSSYFISYTLFSLLLGILVDRYDARFLLTFFVLLLGIGVYLMSRATSLIQASIFFTLAGIGQSACWVPVVTVVQRWVRDKRRGVVLSIVDLGSGSGIVTLGLVMPLLVTGFGWRSGWICLGVFGGLVGVLNFFLIKSYPPELEKQTDQAVNKPASLAAAFLKIFKYKEFWLIGFSYQFICFSILIPFAFLTSYATEVLLVPFHQATRLIVVIAVSGIVGRLTLGYLSDIMGRIKAMMFCGFFVALGGLGMVLSGGYFPLLLSSVVFGFGYGSLWAIYAAASRDFFPTEFAGRVIGLWTVFLGVGSIISPIITGWTIDISGGYYWAFILVLASGVLSLAMLIPILIRPPALAPG